MKIAALRCSSRLFVASLIAALGNLALGSSLSPTTVKILDVVWWTTILGGAACFIYGRFSKQ